jgi:hypothetical protein
VSLHKHRRERADCLAKNPAKEYAELKTVYSSTKLGTLKKRSGATSLNEAREALLSLPAEGRVSRILKDS